jgi:hypothetical protein
MKRLILLLTILLVSGCIVSNPKRYKKGKSYKAYFQKGKY